MKKIYFGIETFNQKKKSSFYIAKQKNTYQEDREDLSVFNFKRFENCENFRERRAFIPYDIC